MEDPNLPQDTVKLSSKAINNQTVFEGSTNLRATAFCVHDLEINSMTLDLEGDLDLRDFVRTETDKRQYLLTA